MDLEEVIGLEVLIVRSLKLNESGHEFTQGERGGSAASSASRGGRGLLVERVKGLAKVIEFTEESDELAHRGFLVGDGGFIVESIPMRGALFHVKSQSLSRTHVKIRRIDDEHLCARSHRCQ